MHSVLVPPSIQRQEQEQGRHQTQGRWSMAPTYGVSKMALPVGVSGNDGAVSAMRSGSGAGASANYQ